MSEKILVINLSEKVFIEHPYSVEKDFYGRGLVLNLIEQFVPNSAEKYSEDNVIVIAPGLFAGNKAPSACRMFIATSDGKEKGVNICNTTGNLPQKIGSLGYAAIVITGKADKPGACVTISENGVIFENKSNLLNLSVSEIIKTLKNDHNEDIGIIGNGICGDMRMSLSSMFLTYPNGSPEYHSPRSGFGDVFGAKNLKAVIIDSKKYFDRDNKNPNEFWELSKKLTQKIINDDICGGALPSFGSITIMKILQDKASIQKLKKLEKSKVADKVVEKEIIGLNINRTCAPMCAIGCLNRHSGKDGNKYESPSQVEVESAVYECFGIKDYELSSKIQNKASEMGLVSVEYVTAARAYAEAMSIPDGEKHLIEWLDEIEKGSLVGRVIASRTYGIRNIFADKNLEKLMDRKAIQDESLFEVKLNSKYIDNLNMSSLELLYAQIFVLENLGFCIFTSFALLSDDETFEILAKMFQARTGIAMDGSKLIQYANECIRLEHEYEHEKWVNASKTNIPPFTKVLYRYFGKSKEEN